MGTRQFIFFYLLFISLAYLPNSAESESFDHTHSTWNKLLSEHVVIEGKKSYVNYPLLVSHKPQLEDYLTSLSSITETTFQSFSRDQQLAFLINSYNAFTWKLIVDNYPVGSIKDLGSLLKTPWQKKFFKLRDEQRCLDDIEHEMIRKQFAEPRIHFAVVCASKGCPALQNQAFTDANLEQLLEYSTINFLTDPDRNALDTPRKIIKISKIFQWFEQDFSKSSGSVEAFVAGRITDDLALQERIRTKEFDKQYLDYDWDLNERVTTK